MRFNKKYLIYIPIFIILCFTIAGIVTRPTIKLNGYSSDNVLNTIEELSSDKYQGRSYGSKGNELAVAYIEKQFKAIGLTPAGENGTYFQNFNEIAKSFKGKSALELLDKNGKIIKEYKYGEDFIEQSNGLTCSGEVTSEWKYISLSAWSKAEDCRGHEIAVTRFGETASYYPITALFNSYLHESKYKALIRLVPESTNLRYVLGSAQGTSLGKSGYEIPAIIAKDKVAKDLYDLENEGYKIHLKSTFNIESKKISNVLGMIPGRSNEYLLITAHLDHVGPDSYGTIYPGALDNASGVSTMLEIARYIKSQNVKPLKNIVFVAFNGEEGGGLGSYNYISHPIYPLYKTTVINLDMIGSKREMPILIAYNTVYYEGTDPSAKLRHALKKLGKAGNLEISDEQNESSDHAYFTYYDVPAVTLINMDMTKIHSPEDNISNIGKSNIDRALKLITGYIALNAYSNFSVDGYSILKERITYFLKAQYPLFIILVMSLLVFYMRFINKNNRRSSLNNKIPLLTLIIALTVTSMISYFPANSQNLSVIFKSAAGLLKYGIDSLLKSFLLFPYFVLFMLPGSIALWISHSKIHNWSYQGNGKGFEIVYNLSMLSVVVTSLYMIIMYNTPVYLSMTPEFARGILQKAIVNIAIAVAAFGVYKLFCREVGIKTKGLKNFIAFSIILLIFLSSFYTPIFVNGKAFKANSSSVKISNFEEDTSSSKYSNH